MRKNSVTTCRDRVGSFEPQLIKKGQRRFNGFGYTKYLTPSKVSYKWLKDFFEYIDKGYQRKTEER